MSPLNFFQLAGGLGLFIFGMKQMGEGLQKIAGNKLQKMIGLLTTNPLLGIMVGALVTALIQSSSATTVMTVGFVNAGLMTLRQAMGIIMGANIGTTITAQLIAFNLGDFALPAVAIGAGLLFFSSKKSFKYMGQILLGFGVLFLGLDVMKETMEPLAASGGFRQLFYTLGANPILGVFVGIMSTALVQSSSATIGILIGLASVGAIDYQIAIPILLGDNIGTTITALLSSFGTKMAAKRAALGHMLFNVLGTTLFLIIFYFIPNIANLLESFFNWIAVGTGRVMTIERLIANTHTLFNLANTIIWLPFINFLTALVLKIIPGQEEILTKGPIYLDERMLKTPIVALEQAHKELLRMADLAYSNVGDARRAFLDQDEKLIENVLEREEAIDKIEAAMNDYLVKLLRMPLSEENSNRINNYFNLINDIERIGDHAENIVELAQFKIQESLPFSDIAVLELNNMFDRVMQTIDEGIKALTTNDLETAVKVLRFEDEVDRLENQLRDHHIARLNKGLCYPGSGVIFLDLISNLERIGDHASNMAKIILKSRK